MKQTFIDIEQIDVTTIEDMARNNTPVVIVSKPTMDELIAENETFMKLVARREEELQAVIWERDKAWEEIDRLQRENNTLKFIRLLGGGF